MSAYDHDAVPKRARRRTGGPCDAERAYWPKFTLEEVARHKSLKDGWIVVHERVFDITTFAITHPGFHNAGQVSTALAITRNLGEDCTDEFVAIHSPTAWTQLHDFQIGVLVRDGDEARSEDVNRVATPRTHPVPRRNRRPMPEWLSADREFWDRYAGGVDERVLAYLDAQGYPQERGGVEARGGDEGARGAGEGGGARLRSLGRTEGRRVTRREGSRASFGRRWSARGARSRASSRGSSCEG
jgi:glycosylphosphatidylinositol deacylase